MLRVVSYDRNLAARTPKAVTIVVTYQKGDAASEATHRSVAEAIETIAAATTVSGLPVRVVSVPYTTAERLVEHFGEAQATAVYVCPGLHERLTEIAGAARRKSVLTVSGSEAFVNDGLSVSIVNRDDKATILINLNQARAEGIHFAPELMRIAQIVR